MSLFAWLISYQSAVLFSRNKPATSNQSAVLFSPNKPAPAISHQPNEQAAYRALMKCRSKVAQTYWSGVLAHAWILNRVQAESKTPKHSAECANIVLSSWHECSYFKLNQGRPGKIRGPVQNFKMRVSKLIMYIDCNILGSNQIYQEYGWLFDKPF
jgi:hypothetical protein